MKYSLDDIVEIISGGTPKTGIKEYWDGEIPWISIKDITSSSNKIQNTEKYVTRLGVENSSTNILKEGDIILTARGTVGEVGRIVKPMAFNQSCFGLRAKTGIVTSDFLYYKLKTIMKNIKNHSHGSVFNTINRETFKHIFIDLPSLEEQKRIGNILTALDDKIELNNQMNQTLEEIASLLYKRWFVDFEFPDDKGNPYKSSGGEMVDSELGMIPKGWEVKELGEIIKFIKGKKPNKIKENKVVGYERYMTIKGITNTEILYADPENTIKIGHNDVSMVMDGASSGDIYTNIEGVLSSTFSKIETEVPNSYIFQVLNYYESDIKKNLTGSAIPHTDKGYINRLLIVVPKNLLLEKLSKKFAFFIQYINGNIKESNVLSEQKKIILKILI